MLLVCEKCHHEWHSDGDDRCPCCQGIGHTHPDADENAPHGVDQRGDAFWPEIEDQGEHIRRMRFAETGR